MYGYHQAMPVLSFALSPLDTTRLAGAVVALLLVYVIVEDRSGPGWRPLVLLQTAVAVWLLADFLTASAVGLHPAVFWAKVVYSAVPFVVLGFFLFALSYAGHETYLTTRVVALLSLHPLAVIATVWTNQHHGLFWTNVEVAALPYWTIRTELGPAFYVHTVYSYLLLLVGTGLLVQLLMDSQHLYPRQVYAVLVATVLPWATDILLQLGVTRVEYTPVAFVITCLLLTMAVRRFRLFSTPPVTQESVIENIRDGLFVLDEAGTVTECNSVAREYLALSDEPVVGEPVAHVLDPYPALLAAVRRTEQGTAEVEVTVENEQRVFELQVTPLVDHREALIGYQCLLHDVTDRKRRERELERQNEQLERFAGVVSHDLRNPLNVASGQLQLARQTGDERYFDAVASAHDRMDRLITDVLALAREGQTIGDTQRVSLPTVARRAWDTVRTPEANLTVDAGLTLEADPDRLQRLFENLFRNAIEHGRPAVSVEVGAVDDGTAGNPVGFYVADDGPGIPDEDREAVLEPGFTSSDGGTGLGLAIVRAIAEAHGWTVSISDSTSGGARFEIRDTTSATTAERA